MHLSGSDPAFYLLVRELLSGLSHKAGTALIKACVDKTNAQLETALTLCAGERAAFLKQGGT